LAVVSQSELILQRAQWKRNGQRVVCAAGAFDLLHPGHVRLLEHARTLGDVLVVGVQSDAGIKAAGSAQPINPESERAEILAALAAVDYVAIYDQPTSRDFIARLAPDVLVRGGEITSRETDFLDDEAARAVGANVVRIPLEPGYSTAALLERIKTIPA
jgi:rfaE bifunctional protein nucleotidyltransferase chain/domain